MATMQIVDVERLRRLSVAAGAAQRGRANENLHADLSDAVQRFLNAIEPGSYVRPHRHSTPPKWELFVVLHGRAAALLFDEHGTVTERRELEPGGDVTALEIPESIWHTVVALETGTVLLEIKPGPYSPVGEKEFASWAPSEGAGCARLEHWFRTARPGDTPPD